METKINKKFYLMGFIGLCICTYIIFIIKPLEVLSIKNSADYSEFYIEFNKSIKEDNLNQKIKILQGDKTLNTEIEVSKNKKNVTVIYKKAFELDKQYTLFLSKNIQHDYLIKLKNDLIKKFIIKERILDLKMGLGVKETEYISNNREYNWYLDQKNTGKYSENNCGPATTIMAIKWVNKDINVTVNDARKIYSPYGEWWSTDDVISYLEKNNINLDIIPKPSTKDLKKEIKAGNIIILCINPGFISTNFTQSDNKVGRFYSINGGHFIILKGYRVVDNNLYFESYDSASWGDRYTNGELKGIDRYYKAEEVETSIKNWWDGAIIIKPN